MTSPSSSSPAGMKDLVFKSGLTQAEFDAFFGEDGLTVYAITSSPWRWLITAGQRNFKTQLVSPESLFEQPRTLATIALHASRAPKLAPAKTKGFEQSKLIQWLLRAAQQTTGIMPAAHYSKLADEADIEAFTRLVRMDRGEWDLLNALPSLSAAEIRYFEQSHNAALSDIESAFLPARMELPVPLANFYIRYLTQARRDVEAALNIAQATHSTRLPRLMSDALAISAFEGAGVDPITHERIQYASSTIYDTSGCIDAAMRVAQQKLTLAIDHDRHLLRLNMQDLNQLAAEIVDIHRLQPFAFLMKAKQLLIARADVSRFPPLQRFATSVQERDLNIEDAWVKRIALAYERLFEGKAMPIADLREEDDADVLHFPRKA